MSKNPYAKLLVSMYKFPSHCVEAISTILTEEDIIVIQDAILTLSKKPSGQRMQTVIHQYFGIGHECMTLAKISKQLHQPVSVERVRSLRVKGVHIIRAVPAMRPIVEKICAAGIEGASWYVATALSLPSPVQMKALRVLSAEALTAVESTDDWRSLPVFSPDFSQRTLNVLRNNDIRTLGQLCNMTVSELLRTPNFGRKSLPEIEEHLASIGKKLRH